MRPKMIPVMARNLVLFACIFLCPFYCMCVGRNGSYIYDYYCSLFVPVKRAYGVKWGYCLQRTQGSPEAASASAAYRHLRDTSALPHRRTQKSRTKDVILVTLNFVRAGALGPQCGINLGRLYSGASDTNWPSRKVTICPNVCS